MIPQWCSVPSSATEAASSSLEGGEEEGGDDDDNIAYSTVVVSVTHTHTHSIKGISILLLNFLVKSLLDHQTIKECYNNYREEHNYNVSTHVYTVNHSIRTFLTPLKTQNMFYNILCQSITISHLLRKYA